MQGVVILVGNKDYYEILGISRNANENEIKRAYRKLAKKYHPDTNPGNQQAEKKFKEITEAYDILSNPEKKKLYDQFGHSAFDGTGASQNEYRGYQGNNGQYQEFHFTGGDAEDIFQDIFGNMFHGRNNQEFRKGGFYSSDFGRNDQRYFCSKGEDVTAQINISFDEAVLGCDKVIHLNRPDKINGEVQSLQVHIPAGIETGKSIRLRGKGMPGINGGESGDLLLEVTVAEKHGFKRDGMDVYTNVQIPFTTAVFGGEAVVKTLYGNVICKIQPGTQSGTKIRLRGKGIVSMKNPSAHGDQYVTIQIQVPRNLNPEAKRKLREFQTAC